VSSRGARSEYLQVERYLAGVKLRRPQHPERIAIIAGILLIVANVAIIGTRAEVRGSPTTQRFPAIFELSPQEGETIVPQAAVSVSLKSDYTGQLSIDGQLIPQDQVDLPKVGYFVISFQPSAEHDIREFSPGPHRATIEFWPKLKTYEKAIEENSLNTYTWPFSVA
jgi:hypothetical protein